MSDGPLILDIKGNSLDDGPGIRSVVFVKGCPLTCVWCHNPESKRPAAEISFSANLCIICDTGIETCPLDALSRNHPFFIDREVCDLCFECTDACPSGALSRVGTSMSVESVVAAVAKDKPFFDTSGGGVTFSGGEPTLQMDFLSACLAELKKREIRTLIETCGHFNPEKFQEKIYPWVDMIYFDIKLIDESEHIRYCGRSNQRILANFQELYRQHREGGVPVLPRIPLIPGITDTADNIDGIISLFRQVGVDKAALIPFHPTWQEKNQQIGIDETAPDSLKMDQWISREQVRRCKAQFQSAGINTGR